MTEATEKLVFASPEWVNYARVILEKLVAEHGEAGNTFSVCEIFTNAPDGLAGPDPTTAVWHFRIVDKTVMVGEGKIDGADYNARVTYEQALLMARTVYTPEMVKKMRAERAKASGPTPPPYFMELHNRLAIVTQ